MSDKPAYVSLSSVQTTRKLVLVGLLACGVLGLALTQSFALGYDAHKRIEHIGIGLLVVCILGRVWCSLYIGGRKVRELVTHGPYSMVRNPLYVFSFIGAAGVGAQTGSLVITAICLVAAMIVFAIVVPQEEAALLKVHGDEYAAYMKRTPRFLPNPTLWWDEAVLIVQPVRVMRTFADGLVFLLAIPIAEGIEYLQVAGYLHTFANLP